MSIIALLSVIMTITVNVLANVLPINGYRTGDLSDMYSNLFVPAGVTFAIWGIIFIMIFIFGLIYLYLEFSLKKKRRRILLLFIISNILNSSWIFAWHYQHILLSLFIIFSLLITLVFLYSKLKNYKDKPFYKLFVKGTISIYMGWIFIAFIANLFAYLSYLNQSWFRNSEVFWTILALVIGLIVSLTFTYFQRNTFFNGSVIWAYSGIVLKRMTTDPDTTYPIALVAGLSILLIVIYTINRFKRKVKY